MSEAGAEGAGARGSAKGLLRIVGYAWIAFFATVLLVTAGVDWLADLRPGTTPLDFSRWTYFEEIAGMVPGVLAVLLTRWI
jgi:hypothetical protein